MILFDVILTYVNIIKHDFDRFSYFQKKTNNFITDSTVPTSGIARRDPPRHVDVIIQILVKIRCM